MIIGKERHDVGRQNDKGYPVRAIIAGHYFYSLNFNPNRWPAGNPETGYLNTDGSPTKTEILNLKRKGLNEDYWNLSFGKRPEETLYDVRKDPDCIENIAQNNKYSFIKDSLRKKTSDAYAKGIFGAPTFVANDKIFWGQDRIEFVLNEASK